MLRTTVTFFPAAALFSHAAKSTCRQPIDSAAEIAEAALLQIFAADARDRPSDAAADASDAAIEAFCALAQHERRFAGAATGRLMHVLCGMLEQWPRAPVPRVLGWLQCVRLLSRDPALLAALAAPPVPECLSALLAHFAASPHRLAGDVVAEIVSMLARAATAPALIASTCLPAVAPLALLLARAPPRPSPGATAVLHNALLLLVALARATDDAASLLGAVVEPCVNLTLMPRAPALGTVDFIAAGALSVLLALCGDARVRSIARDCGGVAATVQLLAHCAAGPPTTPRRERERKLSGSGNSSSNSASVSVSGRRDVDEVGCWAAELLLAFALESPGLVREAGAVPVLVRLLAGYEPSSAADTATNLAAAAMQLLAQLVRDDASIAVLCKADGVHVLAHLLQHRSSTLHVATGAVITLRRCYRLERFRPAIKALWPPTSVEEFVGLDVSSTSVNLDAIAKVVHHVWALEGTDAGTTFSRAVSAARLAREPSIYIRDYGILETLGRGSYGTVYRVVKRGTTAQFAMKEFLAANPRGVTAARPEDDSFRSILSELQAIESGMRHPNVVRYLRSFLEGANVYVVMELVEGLSLKEHLASAASTNSPWAEAKIWKFFVQLCSGLRYVHKEKRVVHRDLNPSNVVVTWDETIKIVDFGLSKHRSSGSTLMNSVCGTMHYWCPELYLEQPYGDKADIWALGCLLYEMAELRPPFASTNILVLAKTIVEGTFPPVRPAYSALLSQTVADCLTADPSARPDILGVCARIAPQLVLAYDAATANATHWRGEASKERELRVQASASGADASLQPPSPRQPRPPPPPLHGGVLRRSPSSKSAVGPLTPALHAAAAAVDHPWDPRPPRIADHAGGGGNGNGNGNGDRTGEL